MIPNLEPPNLFPCSCSPNKPIQCAWDVIGAANRPYKGHLGSGAEGLQVEKQTQSCSGFGEFAPNPICLLTLSTRMAGGAGAWRAE